MREIAHETKKRYATGVLDHHNSVEGYDRFLQNTFLNATLEQWVRSVLAQKPVCRVLDIGCGDGGALHGLKHMFGKRVVTGGADLLPPKNAPDVFVEGDALETEWGQWDIILSFRALHEVGEVEAVTQKAARALFPGGKAVLFYRVQAMEGGRVVWEANMTGADRDFLERADQDRVEGCAVRAQKFEQITPNGIRIVAGVVLELDKA